MPTHLKEIHKVGLLIKVERLQVLVFKGWCLTAFTTTADHCTRAYMMIADKSRRLRQVYVETEKCYQSCH